MEALNVCNFCAKKSKILNSAFGNESLFIKALLDIFATDIKEVQASCFICSQCLKQLNKCNVFAKQIKEAAIKLKNVTENPKNYIVDAMKEESSDSELTIDSWSECETDIGNETLSTDSKIQSGLDDCNSIGPNFRPILPKYSDAKTIDSGAKNACAASPITSRLYRCLKCKETFKSFKQLHDHESKHINIIGVNMCEYCHICYKDLNTLNNHRDTYHAKQQYICCLCDDKVFKSKGYLTRHISQIHQHSYLQHFCGECEVMLAFNLQQDIKLHFIERHTSEDPPDNPKNSKQPESLNEEDMDLEMHEEFLDEFLLAHTNENSFQFSECWDALDLHLPDMLQGHAANFHNSEEFTEAFPCPKCFEQFKNPQPLLKHLAEKHNLPVLICRNCGKAFASLKDCKLHRLNKCDKVNSDDRLTVPCPYCAKHFSSTPSLKQHLRIVHTHCKKHICQLCDKQYSTLDHLKKHVLSQHQNERKHVCEVCNKSFTQLCHLKQHAAIHTTGKTIQCNNCPLKFWRNIDLERHQRKKHTAA